MTRASPFSSPVGSDPARLRTIAFNRDGSQALIGGADNNVRLWDLPHQRERVFQRDALSLAQPAQLSAQQNAQHSRAAAALRSSERAYPGSPVELRRNHVLPFRGYPDPGSVS